MPALRRVPKKETGRIRDTLNPIDAMTYPVRCTYPECGEILHNPMELDGHISEDHLTEAVWLFATENTMESVEVEKATESMRRDMYGEDGNG